MSLSSLGTGDVPIGGVDDAAVVGAQRVQSCDTTGDTFGDTSARQTSRRHKQPDHQDTRAQQQAPRRRRVRVQHERPQESDQIMSIGPRTPHSRGVDPGDDPGDDRAARQEQEAQQKQLAPGSTSEMTEAHEAHEATHAQRSLREWRIARGMTQQQVAFASGLGITSVRDIERERRVPTIVTARKLVRALGIMLEQVKWLEERYPPQAE